MSLIVYFSLPCHCFHHSFLSVFISLSCICYVSIYTLSDLGVLSYLIGLLSLTVQQYSPPACFFQNNVMFLQRILLIKWDKSQPGNSQPSSLIGTCLTLPNLGFLWVFFKYPKISKNGNLLFFPVQNGCLMGVQPT